MKAQKFEKFIKLMMMTQSSSEREALTAIRKANGLLMEANLNWDEFLRGKAKIDGSAISNQASYGGKKYQNAVEIEAMLNSVLSIIKQGTSFYTFIQSLNEWWEGNGFLTEKQYNALRKTYERI